MQFEPMPSIDLKSMPTFKDKPLLQKAASIDSIPEAKEAQDASLPFKVHYKDIPYENAGQAMEEEATTEDCFEWPPASIFDPLADEK